MKYPKTPRIDFSSVPSDAQLYAKIKLHGTFASVYTSTDGEVKPGSRNTTLGGSCGSHYGFDRYVRNFSGLSPNNTLIVGEWCARKVQSKGICPYLEKPHYFIFGLVTEGFFHWMPDDILKRLPALPDSTSILPLFWEQPVTKDDKEKIEDAVDKIDKQDPFALETFGIDCVGEGLVLMPPRFIYSGSDCLLNNTFKVKGKSHK